MPSLKSQVPDLILRSASSRVSKDEWHLPGHMVRDGAFAPPHHEGMFLRGAKPFCSLGVNSADSVSLCDGDAVAA
ncbi:hypothetical protein CQ10_16820 [Bradyrhizobium valentinum]|uniref:Uncharacterized protein n=1 Tax=Bradyrhizobium valentinum TaxID=1518501 RepID=A0A0R3KNH1_9BRAD|nr:hypothetical protein CP49_34135 [Bradyrhizobium valentinum]KRR05688.1 hypothetical protein CQ10_16820 [Bradyrhizobium valentinum]